MKKLPTRFLLPLFLLLLLPADRSLTNPVIVTHLDLEQALPGPGSIPGDGSTWHEIFMVYCSSLTQTSYADNDDDDALSPGDYLGVQFQEYEPVLLGLLWAGLDYFMTLLPAEGGEPLQVVYNPNGVNCIYPLAPHDPTDPVGESWTEMYPYPDFCNQIQVDEWLDLNSNQILDAGDEFLHVVPGEGTDIYHIDRVATAVNLYSPVLGTKMESWSVVKESFSDSNSP